MAEEADKIVVRVHPKIADMIPRYLDNQRLCAQNILEAVAAEDFHTAERLAHDMKGSGGGYGFPFITTVGDAMEKAARSADGATIRAKIEALHEYLDRVVITS